MLVALLLLFIGWVYYQAIAPELRILSHLPSGYYGAQTEAFAHRQLHLKIDPDPKLLALANPYAGPQGASRPHDMSYYRGRFYLYYGATPVIILYLPWKLLTGTYLSEAVGMTAMLYGGFVLIALWLTTVRQRWFPDLSIGWLLLLIGVLGFSPPLATSIGDTTFYLVPIAGGFFCAMAGFTAINAAVSTRRLGAQAAWLAIASLWGGLAVGARPIYVLGLTVLAIPAGWLWWSSGRTVRWTWPGLRLLAAVVVPAAVVGAGIATHNYLRFDDPLDFGIRFSMASGDLREARLVGTEFIAKNIGQYLFKQADFVRYFPFLITSERPWGLLPHLPFVLLAVFFPLTWLDPRLRRREWVLPGLILLGGAGANFGLLCLFFGDEERYFLDFVPMLTALSAAVALAGLSTVSRLPGRLPRLLCRIPLVLLAIYALCTGLMLGLTHVASVLNLAPLARLLNTPAHWAEQRAGTVHGPLEITVEFPRDRLGRTEPLVTTGYSHRAEDVVSVHYLDENHVQFSAFHLGRGGPVSEPIPVDFAKPHRIRIDLGSLYPPPEHPLFATYSSSQIARIRRRLKVTLDEQAVLQGNMTVYPSTPAHILTGRGALPSDVADPLFTGRILSQRRLGLDPSDAQGNEINQGAVRLTVRFPRREGDEGLPLVSTGRSGAGDLVFAQLTKSGEIRFGHDSWGAGAILSPSLPLNNDEDHVIDVEMGSLYAPEKTGPTDLQRQRLRIALDGITLLDTSRPFNPSAPDEVEFGFNLIRSSSAIDYFPGAIRQIQAIPPSPPDRGEARWGPLRLSVLFPTPLSPISEPILITGHTGRADVLFVRYEPDGSLRFGLDHWGVGSALSEAIKVDRSVRHLLEIRSGALLPGKDDPLWKDRDRAEVDQLRTDFEVRLDGRIVFTPNLPPFSNDSGEVVIGSNLIGASSCEPNFSGQFLLVERLAW